MEHQVVEPNQQAHEENSPLEYFLDEDDILANFLEGLCTLVDNLVEDWSNHRSCMIEHNLAETTSNMIHFSNNAMVGYFTDRPPFLQDFEIWVKEEFERKSGWPMYHTRYLGKKFFLIEFADLADRDVALDFSPWFHEREFL